MLNRHERQHLENDLEWVERQNRFRFAAGIANYFGIFLGIACILLCIALIISLLNWLYQDILSNFAILIHNLR